MEPWVNTKPEMTKVNTDRLKIFSQTMVVANVSMRTSKHNYLAGVHTTLFLLCVLSCFGWWRVSLGNTSTGFSSFSPGSNLVPPTFLSFEPPELPEPDPIPAVKYLLTTRRPFRIVFTVQHHPTKTGIEQEYVGKGNLLRAVTFNSADFEAKIRSEDFVMELLVGITNPFVSGFVSAGEARGFLSESNLCWTAMAGQNVELEEGFPTIDDGILAGGVPVKWSPRANASIWRNWVRAALRAGIYEMDALNLVDSNKAIISLPTGVRKFISLKTQDGQVREILLVEADGTSMHMVQLDEFRQWPFGRYPTVITRYWRLPGGTWIFGKKFVLHEFEWIEEPMPHSAFLPKPEYFRESGPLPVGIFLERSNKVYSLIGTNWLPVSETPPKLPQAQIPPLGSWAPLRDTTGIRTAMLATLVGTTIVFGLLALWKVSHTRRQQNPDMDSENGKRP